MLQMLPILHTIASTEEAGSEGIGALGLDPIQILAQALTFFVLFFLVKKFAMDGLVKKLDQRHNDINRGLHLTAEMDKMKAELDERVEKAMKDARKEADAILAEAKLESSEVIKLAEESAHRKADGILKDAEGKIEREITQAKAQLRGEMADLVIEATEAVLRQKLDGASDKKLVESYLKEVK